MDIIQRILILTYFWNYGDLKKIAHMLFTNTTQWQYNIPVWHSPFHTPEGQVCSPHPLVPWQSSLQSTERPCHVVGGWCWGQPAIDNGWLYNYSYNNHCYINLQDIVAVLLGWMPCAITIKATFNQNKIPWSSQLIRKYRLYE